MGTRGSSNVEPYRAKRDFDKTPEPRPSRRWRKAGTPVFVIHRHEARRLHYDLRIELDGVLKSWAVPKGFSYDPSEKRLAVRTEDHPLAYEDFDGVIPKGQYGAGTMTIWDRGHYEWATAGDPAAALEKGKLELRFFGGRLRGEWHLVKLKRGANEWLMFKSRDRYARGKDEPAFSIDLTTLARKPLPRRVQPMVARRVSEPFDDPEWLYELRLTGLRVLAERHGESIRFRGSRRKLPVSRMQHVVDALLELRAEVALVDGVLVCLDDSQRPSCELLEQVLAGKATRRIDYYVFDLLYYEEWDLRTVPLLERKAALASILPGTGPLVFVEHERSRSRELLATIAAAGLYGCVAKRADSRYSAGAADDWQEFAIEPSQSVDVDLVESLAGWVDGSSDGLPEEVRFTNLDKVLWPRDGYTKGDLIRYYDQIVDVLLPYLKDRPLSLHRFPNGIEAESFFQKNTPAHFPEWVTTALVPDSRGRNEEIRFVICQDRATLLYLANLASVELHPWSSRLEWLDTPDWAILDLDPATSDFGKVVRVARLLGKLLRGIGLRPHLKTSGAKGLHIYIPLQVDYSYEQVRMFCEGVARYAAYELREIATVERSKERRAGKVYLDFLQNRRGQTIVAPYSVRPVPGAAVSTPLDWDELSVGVHPSQFNIETVPARLAAKGDLFRAALTDRQDLMPAIDAFQAMAENR